MKRFSLPADFSEETIIKFNEFNNQQKNSLVHETYGQLTEGYLIKSGREKECLPKLGIKELEKYVDFSLKNGIKFNYTLNPACLGNMEFTRQGEKEIKRLLKDLWNIGIRDLTISSPVLIEIANLSGIEFNIKVSAIGHVDSITKLKFYKDLGVKRVVIEPDTYRDFSKLKQMSLCFNDGVEIIINDTCYKNCPYKIFHYNHEAHSNDRISQIKGYFFMRCGIQKSYNLRNYLKLNWIRPENIKLYENIGIHNFKIQGRPFVSKGDIMNTLMCYSNEHFDGNLLELLHLFAPYDSSHQPYIDNKYLEGFIEGFYNKKVKCLEICDDCRYCDQYVEKAIREPEGILEDAMEFYKSHDQFIKMIEET